MTPDATCSVADIVMAVLVECQPEADPLPTEPLMVYLVETVTVQPTFGRPESPETPD